MKKYCIVMILMTLLLCAIVAGCTAKKTFSTNSVQKQTIGVIVGTFGDTWRTFVRNTLYKSAEEHNIQIDIWSGNNTQATQNEKVERMLQNKVSALAINLVDPASAGGVINKAQQANIPVVFFNREPQLSDLQKWDKAYYVGAKAEQAGVLEGQILVRFFKSHPPQAGVIRYVMIKGEPGHQDTVARTTYSVKALEDAGFRVQMVAEEAAMWERSKAQTIMENILAKQVDAIDCVIANNDDMALGAIDALKSKGYFQNGLYMPVVGVDATGPALNALQEGTLLGTVLNDAATQGKAIFNLSYVLGQDQVPDVNNCEFNITDGKYIWVDYRIITKENINDAK